jgi:prepilin-type N-terminal cleavage/methylation domain-containing protein/prepilin-type processing-associated H-X9-DG protein
MVLKLDSITARAFTLIELLVVLAIIGVLSALLLPALSKANAYSKSVTCKGRLRQMGISLQMYVHDNQGRYPHYLGPAGPSYGDDPGKKGRATGLVYWSSKLFPYYHQNWTNSAFQCAGYRGKISGPEIPGAVDRYGGYAYNTGGAGLQGPDYLGLGPIMFWKDKSGGFIPAVAEPVVRAPSEMVAITDSLYKVALIGGSDVGRCKNLFASALEQAPYALPHKARHNVLMCDGRVASIAPAILFDPAKSAANWNYDNQAHPELWR